MASVKPIGLERQRRIFLADLQNLDGRRFHKCKNLGPRTLDRCSFDAEYRCRSFENCQRVRDLASGNRQLRSEIRSVRLLGQDRDHHARVDGRYSGSPLNSS